MIEEILIGFAGAIAALWLVLAIVLLIARPDRESLAEALRLPLDLTRFVRNLLARDDLPRGARVRLWVLIIYLVMPIDLVPDFIPVIGYADDVIVTALLLRGVARAIGRDAFEESWPGTEEGLVALLHLCGMKH